MLAGRLADPNCTLGTDPRSDPRMVAAFAPLGLADVLPDAPISLDSPIEHRLAYAAAAEVYQEALALNGSEPGRAFLRRRIGECYGQG